MSGFLLDTNVVSELSKPKHRRDARLISWMAAHRGECWLSVVTILEITKGIHALRHRQPERAARLDAWFAQVRGLQGNRIIIIDEAIARLAGEWMAEHGITVEDALIAATAERHGLVCVTANARHFVPTKIDVIDPSARSR
jgi:predicted nucleic acid-binding protein